jgi:1-deoxy-D-xylulose-5-phosphate reductoisomerase
MCVQYAVDYPTRCHTASEQLDLFSVGKLTFMKPDTEAFPLLSLAVEAMSVGGAMPAVLNAADEVAVAAFLDGRISFCQISEAVSGSFDALLGLRNVNSIDGLIEADKEARLTAEKFIKEY